MPRTLAGLAITFILLVVVLSVRDADSATTSIPTVLSLAYQRHSVSSVRSCFRLISEPLVVPKKGLPLKNRSCSGQVVILD